MHEGKRVSHRLRIRRYDMISNGILLFGLLAVGLPLLNHVTSERVMQISLGKDIQCTDMSESAPQTSGLADAIVVLGAGLKSNDDGTWEPNSFESQRLNAGAGLYVAGYLDGQGKVVLLDGRLPDGAQADVDKRYFVQRVDNNSHGTVQVEESDVIVDTASVNTATGMDVLKNLADANKWDVIIVVTDEFHKNRAIEDALERGLCIKVITVEEYVSWFDPASREQIEQRNASSGMQLREIKENIGLLLHMYDPKWKLRSLMKQ